MGILIAAALAYLIGAFPLEEWIVKERIRALTGPDFAARHRREAALVTGAEMLKGAVAVLVALFVAGPAGAFLAAFAVVFGDLYSVFLGFRGGKGVGVAAGALLILSPLLLAAGLLLYFLFWWLTGTLFWSVLLTLGVLLLLALIWVGKLALLFLLVALGLLILSRLKPHGRVFVRGFRPPFGAGRFFRR
jgi:acyl phosphate:glycerol-3-phosphate acyltransferase